MSETSCVFCKIVRGQIPALRVYEDDHCLAFLDIGPLAEGHLLLIPKAHYQRLEDMPADEISAVFGQVPRLARAVMKVSGANAYNVLQNNGQPAGQEVPHVHFHIIPRVPSDGLGYRWNASKYPAGRGEELRQRLADALASL